MRCDLRKVRLVVSSRSTDRWIKLRTITIGYHQRDTNLKHGSEEGHCVFEKVVGDLHDTRCVLAAISLYSVVVNLHDGDIWGLLHLKSCIHEAILWHPGIGINEQNDLTTAHQ